MTGLVMSDAQNVISGVVLQAGKLMSEILAKNWKIETDALKQMEQMFIVV